MQIERIYQPNMQSQMRAIMILLHIQLPGKYTTHMPEIASGTSEVSSLEEIITCFVKILRH